MEIAEWKDVIGFEGLYQVSSLGEVKSTYRGGRVLKPGTSHNGYHFYRLYKDKNHTMFRCGRLVATHFIPNPENKSEVNHKNGIKTDDRVSNLEWCTRSENMNHAIRTGLKKNFNKGEKCPFSKLERWQVILIRDYISDCIYSQPFIAEIFNVDQSTISDIKRRKSWKHLNV